MNNINPTFCPNCGHKLGANNYNFCPNCHFNLKQYREGINNNTTGQIHRNNLRQQHENIEPLNKLNHPIAWIVGVVVILLIIGIPLVQHHEQQSVTNMTQQNNDVINRDEHRDNQRNARNFRSSNYTNSLLKDVWSQIGTDLNQETSDDDKYSSIAPNFISNNRNKSFKAIYHWLNLIDSSNIEKEIDANAKAYDFKDNNSVYPTSVNFKVRYDFKPYHKPDHVQVFNWHASMNKHKIVSMTSQKKPIQNYNKK